MKYGGGGRVRLAPLIAASLLLHLTVILVAAGVFLREDSRPVRSPRLVVEYLGGETGGKGMPEGGLSRRRALPALSHPRRPPVRTASRITPARKDDGAKSPGSRPAPTAPVVALPSPAPMLLPVAIVPAGGSGGRTEGTGVPGSGNGAGTGRGGSGKGRGGSGGGGGHGMSPAGAPGDMVRERSAYLSLLKRLIEAHKEYPFASRRAGREGRCLRRFTVDRSGAIGKIETLSSCGHAFLDAAATRAIRAVGVFPPLPTVFPGKRATFTVTISFTLESE